MSMRLVIKIKLFYKEQQYFSESIIFRHCLIFAFNQRPTGKSLIQPTNQPTGKSLLIHRIKKVFYLLYSVAIR